MTATPARYRTSQGVNVGGWSYESEEQTQFAFTCAFEGFGLPSFDDYIDTLPDCPVKADLLTWRSHAFNAFKSGNKAALRGWLQAAWVVWKTELTFDHIHPTLKMGVDYSEAQSNRAKKKRSILSPDDGTTVADIVAKLLTEHPNEKAKALWTHFYSELDQRHLEPQEHDGADMAKCSISYSSKDSRKSITFGRFGNLVSESRKKKSR